MITNFKIFEAKQLKLFQTDDSAQDVTKHFLKKFKAAQQKVKGDKFNKISDVLKYYNNDNNINQIVKNIVNDISVDDFSYCDYIINNLYYDMNFKDFIENIKNTLEKYYNISSIDYIDELIDNFISKNSNDIFNELKQLLSELDIDEYSFCYNFIYFYLDKNNLFYKYKDLFIDINYFNDFIYFLEDNYNEDTITIYRAIKLPYNIDELEKRILDYSGVGIYWSYKFEGADPHCGKAGQTIILAAKVNVNNVNWKQTFYKSLYNLNNECEIELNENITVNLTSITLNEKILKLFRYKQEYIYAMQDTFQLSNKQRNDIIERIKINLENDYTIKFEEPLIVKA